MSGLGLNKGVSCKWGKLLKYFYFFILVIRRRKETRIGDKKTFLFSSFSVRGLSPVVASGGHSSSRCAGLSLSRPLLLRSTGSRHAGSVVVAHGPSCSAACGILTDQGSNSCPLHRQADSQPLHHQGSPGRMGFNRSKTSFFFLNHLIVHFIYLFLLFKNLYSNQIYAYYLHYLSFRIKI